MVDDDSNYLPVLRHDPPQPAGRTGNRRRSSSILPSSLERTLRLETRQTRIVLLASGLVVLSLVGLTVAGLYLPGRSGPVERRAPSAVTFQPLVSSPSTPPPTDAATVGGDTETATATDTPAGDVPSTEATDAPPTPTDDADRSAEYGDGDDDDDDDDDEGIEYGGIDDDSYEAAATATDDDGNLLDVLQMESDRLSRMPRAVPDQLFKEPTEGTYLWDGWDRDRTTLRMNETGGPNRRHLLTPNQTLAFDCWTLHSLSLNRTWITVRCFVVTVDYADEPFAGWTRLECIRCGLPRLLRAPFERPTLARLREIVVRDNTIDYIERDTFRGLADLQSLDLRSNHLRRLDALALPRSVRFVDLGYNERIRVDRLALQLEPNSRLAAFGCNRCYWNGTDEGDLTDDDSWRFFVAFNGDTLSPYSDGAAEPLGRIIPSLRWLSLQQVENLPGNLTLSATCHKFPALQRLQLDYAAGASLTELDVRACRSLRTLTVSHGALERLRLPTRSIRALNVRYNRLAELPHGRSLRRLLAEFNLVETVPPARSRRLSALERLCLDGNPWQVTAAHDEPVFPLWYRRRSLRNRCLVDRETGGDHFEDLLLEAYERAREMSTATIAPARIVYRHNVNELAHDRRIDSNVVSLASSGVVMLEPELVRAINRYSAHWERRLEGDDHRTAADAVPDVVAVHVPSVRYESDARHRPIQGLILSGNRLAHRYPHRIVEWRRPDPTGEIDHRQPPHHSEPPHQLSVLRLDECRLGPGDDLNRHYLAGLPGLRYLDLSSNHLRRLPGGFFAAKDALLALDLSHNDLLELTDPLPRLRYLSLDGNRNFLPVPRQRTPWPQLTVFSCERCAFEHLTGDTFAEMVHLAVLRLDENRRLRTIDADFFAGMPCLRQVSVRGTRWYDDRCGVRARNYTAGDYGPADRCHFSCQTGTFECDRLATPGGDQCNVPFLLNERTLSVSSRVALAEAVPPSILANRRLGVQLLSFYKFTNITLGRAIGWIERTEASLLSTRE